MQDKNPAQAVGLWVFLIYLFAVFGMLTEVTTELLGFKPYVSLVFGSMAIFLALVSGGLLRGLQTTIGKLITLFLLWLVVAAPFSSWRGGTFQTLNDTFLRSYMVFFVACTFLVTLEDCRRMIHTIVLGGLSVFLVSLVYGVYGSDGRFIIPFGSLQNPNDLATHLLLVLPLCLIIAATTRRTFTVRPAVLLLSILMVQVSLKTASRAALLSMAIMGLILIWKASPAQKAIAVGCVILMAMVSALVLPSVVWQRFSTMYSDESDVSYGVASRESRKNILMRSIGVTLEHPLVGVGPGTFDTFDAGEAELSGKRAAWVGTHNSYTQVSAEAGIPAFLFFTGAILVAIRTCFRIHQKAAKREDLREISQIALFLLMALSGMAVNIFFSHIAYRYYVPTLLGLTAGFSLVVRDKLAAKPKLATAVTKPAEAVKPAKFPFARPIGY